jgi:hypothetical protein
MLLLLAPQLDAAAGHLGNLRSELRHGLGQVAVFALHGQELMGAQINFFP